MADHNPQELYELRGLVVKLSKEIDYKNHLLMQKEDLSLEKFATMSNLLEEKDRLLGERLEVIGSLMAQKHRLHESYTEGMQNLEDVKLELKKVKHELEVEQRKQEHSTMELVKYQGEADKGLGIVTTTCLSTIEASKSPQMNPTLLAITNDSHNEHDREQKSLNLHEGTSERQFSRAHEEKLKNQIDTLRKELDKNAKELCQIESLNQNLLSKDHSSNAITRKRDIQCMKKQVKKIDDEPQSKMTELWKQTKQIQERKGDQSMKIKMETIDNDFEPLSNVVEPLQKKFKKSMSQNTK